MVTPISNIAMMAYPAMQKPLTPLLTSLPTYLPLEIREILESQLDVAACQKFFEALTIVTRNGEPIDSPALKWHLLKQKVPAEYRYEIVRSDKSLQTFALNQLKILSQSGQFQQLVEKRALMELIKWVGGPALFRFMQDRIEECVELERKLLDWVERSKTEEVQAIATNALMLLVKANVDMTGYDFKGIRVPGADLSGGQFDNANFEGADLSHVNFRRAKLREANLQRTNLTDVRFGKLPIINLGSGVTDCFSSPDGCWLAVETHDEIKLYHLETLALRHTLPRYGGFNGYTDAERYNEYEGHERYGYGYAEYGRYHDDSIFFSPDSKVLALPGGWDEPIRLWRTDSAEELHVLSGHRGFVRSIAFSPNGQLLAAGSTDGKVRLWNVNEGEASHVLEVFANKVLNVKFSPDGKLLATAGYGGEVKLWDVESGQVRRTIPVFYDSPDPYYGKHKVSGLKFSPDGKLLVTGYWDVRYYMVQLWSVESGKQLHYFEYRHNYVDSLDFSPNSELLVVFNRRERDGSGVVWSIKEGKELATLYGHHDLVDSVKFSPDGKYLATGSRDRAVKLWSTESWEVLHTCVADGKARWVNFSLDSKLLMWRAEGKDKSVVKLQNVNEQRAGSYFGPSQKKLKIASVSIEGARGLSLMNQLLLEQS